MKVQLSVFILLIEVSLAVWQRVTVMKGQTLILRCPLTNAHNTYVEWKNPKGYIMFFSHNRALKDKRYTIIRLSSSTFTISISNVNFKDGGNYTCSHYGTRTEEKKVEVTVLGYPKMNVIKHKEQFVIKCTAKGNHHPPQISMKLGHGPEILDQRQVRHEDKSYVSEAMLHIQSVTTRVSVTCLVRHPALLTSPLINFVEVERDSPKALSTTTTSSATAQPKTTTGWFRHGQTTVFFPTPDVTGPSTAPTRFPANPVTSTGSHLSTSDGTKTSLLTTPTSMRNDTISNATSTTGWTPVSETTEETTSFNSTGGNRTVIPGSTNDPKMQTRSGGRSSLLVFLVTCLIVALLVVVIFFTMKLRKAHIAWKRENEESDPSEESSKSKSSQEEKNSQGQRRRGPANIAFTQYVSEEPAAITSVINTAAMRATESVNKEQTSQPLAPSQTSAKCDIKETAL
uniref:cytotoxic and regulatory T-cell molecule isoform X2 n=1 Tax=Monopterus albus TaxID=43700 RepID=UPI0009B33A3A|nr:cytotoxic and regulatory T-cell molecule-like isoform X2 [Monopterus albus]